MSRVDDLQATWDNLGDAPPYDGEWFCHDRVLPAAIPDLLLVVRMAIHAHDLLASDQWQVETCGDRQGGDVESARLNLAAALKAFEEGGR